MVGLIGVSAGVSLQLNKSNSGLTAAEISLLKKSSINKFDRGATENYSHKLNLAGDFAVVGLAAASALAQGLACYRADKRNEYRLKHALVVGAMFLETNILTYFGTEAIKSSVNRTRPFVYNPNVDVEKKLDSDARKSFFSRHTSLAAANCFMAAKVISDYYPKSIASYTCWALAVSVPAAMGYMRVKSGEHFTTDVIAGYGFGALVGFAIPQIHKKTKKDDNIEISSSGMGLSFSYKL